MSPIRKLIKLFLVWRLALFIPVILGSIFLNYGSSYPFFEISYYKNLPFYFDSPIFKTWFNFDGVHYLNIAMHGYITEARFFPLFPIVIYLLSLGNFYFPVTLLVGLILPSLLFLTALVLFYKLLRFDYSDKISQDAVLYLLTFPVSFFFALVYTESLFLFLLLGSFYFARKKNWLGAIFLGFLLCITRFVGVLIIPALIYEYLIQTRKFHGRDYLNVAALILITPLGLVAYAIFNFNTWGSYFYFLTAHAELGNSRVSSGIILPLQTLYRYINILTTLPIDKFEWWIAVVEIAAFIFGTLMLYLAWKNKIRTSYLIFGVLSFLLPSLSGTFSGLPRYLLVLFPIFLALSLISSKVTKKVYLFVSIVLLFILLMFFSRGYYVA